MSATKNAPKISVLIPVFRGGENLRQCIESVCLSVEYAALPEGAAEILLWVDREKRKDDPFDALSEKYPYLRVFGWTLGKSQGGPTSRMNLIEGAQGNLLVFTDDDCRVPLDWILRLLSLTRDHGVVTGRIKGSKKSGSNYAKYEETVDLYRVQAKDSHGAGLFVSFGNLAIHRRELPSPPYDTGHPLHGDDFDLGCRLRLLGKSIFCDETLVVETIYENRLSAILKRKRRHAFGIARTRLLLGEDRWKALKLGGHWRILFRWVGISLRADFGLRERLLFLVINMAYALSFLFYSLQNSWGRSGRLERRFPVEVRALSEKLT